MSFIEKLEWRNATKAFDPSQPVDQLKLDVILRSIRLSPSSFGLQPFFVKVIKDQTTKEQLRVAGWNQVQFTTAPYVLVFVARADVGRRITDLIELARQESPERAATLPMYENMMRGFTEKFDERTIVSWSQRQAYIALGFAMAACAELGIDCCPIEGFEPEEFNRILNLGRNEHASVALPIGYRDPKFNPNKKVRFSETDLFNHL